MQCRVVSPHKVSEYVEQVKASGVDAVQHVEFDGPQHVQIMTQRETEYRDNILQFLSKHTDMKCAIDTSATKKASIDLAIDKRPPLTWRSMNSGQ